MLRLVVSNSAAIYDRNREVDKRYKISTILPEISAYAIARYDAEEYPILFSLETSIRFFRRDLGRLSGKSFEPRNIAKEYFNNAELKLEKRFPTSSSYPAKNIGCSNMRILSVGLLNISAEK